MASSTLPLTVIALYSPSTETQFFPAGQFTLTSVLTWVSKQCKSSLSKTIGLKDRCELCEDLAVVVEIQTPDSGRSSCDHFAWRGLHLATTLIVNIYFAIFVENSNVGQLVDTRSPNTAGQSHVFWGSSFAQGESLIHLSRSMLRLSNSGGQNANLGPIIPGPLCSPACSADSEPEGVVLRHSPHAAATNRDLQRRF